MNHETKTRDGGRRGDRGRIAIVVGYGKRSSEPRCRVIEGSGRMDALSDYICKSNELVDKMVRILIYIQRTAIRKGSKDRHQAQNVENGLGR